jgi:hypothetical protein
MMRSMLLSLLLSLCLPATPEAAPMLCSVRPATPVSAGELRKLAKISQPDAEQIARSALKTTRAISLVSAELELERGCLVWSFDLKVSSRQGVREVWVDAGDGRVLASRYESARQEAEEQKADASR